VKPFESRPPLPIAIVGMVAILLLLVVAYNTDDVPFLGGRGHVVKAEFANAAGIRAGDPVKIAGVIVGRVDDVRLDGNQVVVESSLDEAKVGHQSTASIELNTLLGQRYVAITPAGERELPTNGTIPLSRTTTPFEIVPAINQLSETLGEIDTEQLAASLDTLAETFSDTPDEVRGTLDGLSRLSRSVSSRNDELAQLLGRAQTVTDAVAERDTEMNRLIDDINPLLAELTRRREAIHALLVGAQSLGRELSGLVDDNQATLTPALEDLASVAAVLEQNRENLDAGISAVRTYVHLFTNTVGVGHWFDAYVCGLIPLALTGANAEGCEAS